MMRKPAQIISLIAITLSVLAAAPADATDVAGKWYGRLDSEPVITINKAGAEYSASLDYPDITKSVYRPNDLRPFKMSIHKDIVSFEAAGNTVRFTIRNTTSSNGDVNSARDEYDLTLSQDGLTGTVRHTSNHEGGLTYDHVPVTVAPITLFSTDWNSRSAKSEP